MAIAVAIVTIETITGFIQQYLIELISLQNSAFSVVRLMITQFYGQLLVILPFPYLIIILGLGITGITVLFLHYKIRYHKPHEEQQVALQISMDYLDDEDFESARKYLWSHYESNERSHSKHLLTMVVAMLALFGAWTTLPDNPLILLLFVIIIPFFTLVWLWLRSKYWSIWVNCAMLMTKKDVIDKFNICNLRDKYYLYYQTPCCEAIIHIAIKQKMLDIRTKHKWTTINGMTVRGSIYSGLKK
jgi:hypothetical protein